MPYLPLLRAAACLRSWGVDIRDGRQRDSLLYPQSSTSPPTRAVTTTAPRASSIENGSTPPSTSGRLPPEASRGARPGILRITGRASPTLDRWDQGTPPSTVGCAGGCSCSFHRRYCPPFWDGVLSERAAVSSRLLSKPNGGTVPSMPRRARWHGTEEREMRLEGAPRREEEKAATRRTPPTGQPE